MSKREKIILVFVFIAVIYGGYQFLLSSPSKTTTLKTENEIKTARKLVKDITEHLNKANLSETEKYIISKAETPWLKNPFYNKKRPTKKEATKDTSELQDISFTYTGYIEIGKKRLAIIYGMEYQTGEELEIGEWIVQGIYPTRVVIGIKGKKVKRVIPLEEEIQ